MRSNFKGVALIAYHLDFRTSLRSSSNRQAKVSFVKGCLRRVVINPPTNIKRGDEKNDFEKNRHDPLLSQKNRINPHHDHPSTRDVPTSLLFFIHHKVQRTMTIRL
jgi:hypothetical protein